MSNIKIPESEIKLWLKEARAKGLVSEAGLNSGTEETAEIPKSAGSLLHPLSIQRINQDTVALIRLKTGRALAVFGPNQCGFSGEKVSSEGIEVTVCPLSRFNADTLRRCLPFTRPSPLRDRDVTFGVGDRLGIASPGHIRLFKKYKAAPVLAQQSVRELDLTGRSYEDVLDAASWAVLQEGYNSPWGADGDHLKTEDWVRKALSIGFTMITADVSDFIRAEFRKSSEEEVMQAYGKLEGSYRQRIEERFLDLKLNLDTGERVGFSREELARTALIYREAVNHAERLYRAGIEVKGEGGFDFELSIDETDTPTTPQAHVFIAMEVEEAGIKISSMAPRFVGEFQKGIDYIGDAEEFARCFRTHAAIAGNFGYRISVHSGSDKFTVFPGIGRLTGGRFHIKTAGTNWLEAMKVIARCKPGLYRELHQYALKTFERARKYYHITPNMDNLPDISKMEDEELVDIFTNQDARQVIHISYGEILSDPSLKNSFFKALNEHLEEYWQALYVHIEKHLTRLGVQGEE